MRQLKIGDKIKWNVLIGGGIIYTIKDISFDQPPTVMKNGMTFPNQILFEYQDWDGSIIQSWSHEVSTINEAISQGKILILNKEIEPCQHLPRFSFNN